MGKDYRMKRTRDGKWAVSILIAVVSVLILFLDLALPLGVAGGVPYVVLPLIALRVSRGMILGSAILGSALVILGYHLSAAGGDQWVVLINRALALYAIWVAAILSFQRNTYEKKLREEKERAEQMAEEYYGLSTIDSLTGLSNRRAFDEFTEAEWRRAMRHTSPISVILIDIDFFKKFNDTYGHLAGDICLKRVAECSTSYSRRSGDMAARYGGEEFALLLYGADIEEAQEVACWIRETVENMGIPHGESEACPVVTISLGVATANPVVGDRFMDLLDLADKALYRAKSAGRNRVVACDSNKTECME